MAAVFLLRGEPEATSLQDPIHIGPKVHPGTPSVGYFSYLACGCEVPGKKQPQEERVYFASSHPGREDMAVGSAS